MSIRSFHQISINISNIVLPHCCTSICILLRIIRMRYYPCTNNSFIYNNLLLITSTPYHSVVCLTWWDCLVFWCFCCIYCVRVISGNICSYYSRLCLSCNTIRWCYCIWCCCTWSKNWTRWCCRLRCLWWLLSRTWTPTYICNVSNIVTSRILIITDWIRVGSTILYFLFFLIFHQTITINNMIKILPIDNCFVTFITGSCPCLTLLYMFIISIRR